MTLPPRWGVVARDGDDVVVVTLGDDLVELARERCAPRDWPALAASAPADVRWVWSDTSRWYPQVLAAGTTLRRCHDLRLCHAVLRLSALVDAPDALRAATEWDAAPAEAERAPMLFDLADGAGAEVPDDLASVLAEFHRQQQALADARAAARLRLLLGIESAGALLAAEMHAAGVPWSRAIHERLLEESLGPRPTPGVHPQRVQELAETVRAALGDPTASLDSQPKLLRSLHRAGVLAQSTSRWELQEYDHPVIAPLLQYKKLTRLASANGWTWLDEWAPDGRFRPVYVPGGVVTGRWASSGGGALQLPRQLRPAVHADPGWSLVVADVAQLEPRVLAAMSADAALAAAARGRDLYDGIVAEGIVTTRQEAKIAMLGAMYGATTGDSGRLVPALRRAYPRAMTLLEDAARTGEQSGVVSTWLGRTSPPPSAAWRAVQERAAAPDATEAEQRRARSSARDQGRFTRNFVVQGTAAEWALAWLAETRQRLEALPPADEPAAASGPVFRSRAHLAFLHDEIIVHTPTAQAAAAAAAIADAAASAARGLFGDIPLDFRLDLQIRQDAAKG